MTPAQVAEVELPGPAAVTSIPTASAWLGLLPDVGERWFRDHELVCVIEVTDAAGNVTQHERVSWRAVLAVLEGEPEGDVSMYASTTEAALIAGVDRSTLDEMLDRAPRNLLGAPTQIGSGKRRRHWRWPRAMIHVWLAAYRDWAAARGRRRSR